MRKLFSKLVDGMSPEAQARVAMTADNLRATKKMTDDEIVDTLLELRSALIVFVGEYLGKPPPSTDRALIALDAAIQRIREHPCDDYDKGA